MVIDPLICDFLEILYVMIGAVFAHNLTVPYRFYP